MEWTARELKLLERLDRPVRIQEFLNGLDYDAVPGTASPRRVMRERKANCFEGALFAAAALRHIGHPPALVDMRAHNDDDHVIAVFRRNGGWGCVAKSNFTVLRFREPVYRSIRELVMSFFEVFYNTIGEKTLREYSAPFDLSRYDARGWMTAEEDLEYVGDALDRARHYKVLTPRQVRSLEPVDPDLARAGLIGAKVEGLFVPSPGEGDGRRRR